MTNEALADKQCSPCGGGVLLLQQENAETLHKQLHGDWQIVDNGKALVRRFEFKGFAKSVYLTNLCVWLADQEGHHPDMAFGWGYCQITLTTHDIGGLSENDFIWAAKLDKLVA